MTDLTLSAESTASVSLANADGERSQPAQVYPVTNSDRWVVERPQDRPGIPVQVFFAGSRAQQRALTYAYETFGSVRFFPFVETLLKEPPKASACGGDQDQDAR